MEHEKAATRERDQGVTPELGRDTLPTQASHVGGKASHAADEASLANHKRHTSDHKPQAENHKCQAEDHKRHAWRSLEASRLAHCGPRLLGQDATEVQFSSAGA